MKKLKKAVRKHLGWEVDADGKKIAELFKLIDKDVSIEAPVYHWAVDHLTEAHAKKRRTDASLGISAPFTGNSIFSGGGFSVSGTHSSSHKNISESTEVVLFYGRTARLKKRSKALELATTKGASKFNRYICSGTLAFGFRMIISNLVDTQIDRGKENGKVKANFLGRMIKTKLGIARRHSDADQQKNMNVEIFGIGGFVPKVKFFTADNLEDELNKLIQQFHSECKKAEGMFFYSKSKDIAHYAFDTKYAKLLDLVEKLDSKLSCMVTPGRQEFQNQLIRLRERIYSSEIEDAESKTKLKQFAEEFARIIQDLDKQGTCFLDDFYAICVEEGKYFAIDADKKHLTVVTAQNLCFKLEPCAEVNAFKLVTEDNRYVVLKESKELGESPKCYLFRKDQKDHSDEEQEVNHWYLHADEFRSGVYYLNSNGFTLTYDVNSLTPSIITCGAGQFKTRIAVTLTNNYLPRLLSEIKKDIITLDISLPTTKTRFENKPIKENLKLTLPPSLSNDEELAVSTLIYTMLPQIGLNHRDDLVYFQGIVGAGKSTIMNALLDHSFKKNGINWEIEDRTRPYVEMGRGIDSCTKIPETLKSEFLQLDLTDMPGLMAPEGPLFESALSLTRSIILEKSDLVKSIIVVIEYASLISARGQHFVRLVQELRNLLSVDDSEFPFGNILFVINDKNSDLHHACEDLNISKCSERKFIEFLRNKKITEINQILQSHIDGCIRQYKQNRKKIERKLETSGNNYTSFFSKAYNMLFSSPELSDDMVEKLHSKLLLMKNIQNNYILFSDVNDITVRKEIRKKLKGLKRKQINKSIFRNRLGYQGNLLILDSLSRWLSYKEWELNNLIVYEEALMDDITRIKMNDIEGGIFTYLQDFISKIKDKFKPVKSSLDSCLIEQEYSIVTNYARGKGKKIAMAAGIGGFFAGLLGGAAGALTALAAADKAKASVKPFLHEGHVPLSNKTHFNEQAESGDIILVGETAVMYLDEGRYQADYEQKGWGSIEDGTEVGKAYFLNLYDPNCYEPLLSKLVVVNNWLKDMYTFHFAKLKLISNYSHTIKYAVDEFLHFYKIFSAAANKITTRQNATADSSEENGNKTIAQSTWNKIRVSSKSNRQRGNENELRELQQCINSLENNGVELLASRLAGFKSSKDYISKCTEIHDALMQTDKSYEYDQSKARLAKLEMENSRVRSQIADGLPEYSEIYSIVEPLRKLLRKKGKTQVSYLDNFCGFYIRTEEKYIKYSSSLKADVQSMSIESPVTTIPSVTSSSSTSSGASSTSRVRKRGSMKNSVGNSKQGYIRHKVLGDGDCGYTAFGVTRKQALSFLNEYLDEVSGLLQMSVSDAILTTPEFIEYLRGNQVIEKNTTNKQVTAKLDQYSTNMAVLSAYIQYDVGEKKVDNGWAHPSVLQAIAHIRKIGLRIWRLGAQEQLVPHRGSGYDYGHYVPPQGANEFVDLLFVNNNHFDRLTLSGYTNEELPDSIYPLDSSWSQKRNVVSTSVNRLRKSVKKQDTTIPVRRSKRLKGKQAVDEAATRGFLNRSNMRRSTNLVSKPSRKRKNVRSEGSMPPTKRVKQEGSSSTAGNVPKP